MLKTFTLRETILEYLQKANQISPTVLQAATRKNSIDELSEVKDSPIVCGPDILSNEIKVSGLGLINGLLIYCNEPVITFVTDEDDGDPTIIRMM